MSEIREDAATPIVEMRRISKAFGAVTALADVDLILYPGEILGLVGDNSAGKSTLMKILTGAYQRDSGDVLVAGQETHFKSPHDSRVVGIEMIYQDFALCGNMDVGQNIFLGRWPTRGFFVNRKKMYREAERGAEAPQGRRQLRLPEGREPLRRPPAVGRDRARDLVRSQGDRARRADREPLRHGDRAAARDHAGAQAAQRRADHHQPPPAGHLRGRRPGHGPQARPARRRALHQGHRRARGPGPDRPGRGLAGQIEA